MATTKKSQSTQQTPATQTTNHETFEWVVGIPRDELSAQQVHDSTEEVELQAINAGFRVVGKITHKRDSATGNWVFKAPVEPNTYTERG